MKSWWIKPWYHLVNQRSIFAFSCNHYEASTLSTHFPEVFGILEGSFLSLFLSFFFMISNLQKSCRNSTGYSYYTPYLNSPIIYIFLHLFYYSMNGFICVYHILCSVAQSRLTLCDPMDCTWPGSSVHEDSPDKNTGVGCHALLQGIFPTQGMNPDLPHCRRILYCLSYQRSPRILGWVAHSFFRGSSWSKNWTRGLLHCRRLFTNWVTRIFLGELKRNFPHLLRSSLFPNSLEVTCCCLVAKSCLIILWTHGL